MTERLELNSAEVGGGEGTGGEVEPRRRTSAWWCTPQELVSLHSPPVLTTSCEASIMMLTFRSIKFSGIYTTCLWSQSWDSNWFNPPKAHILSTTPNDALTSFTTNEQKACFLIKAETYLKQYFLWICGSFFARLNVMKQMTRCMWEMTNSSWHLRPGWLDKPAKAFERLLYKMTYIA